MVSNDYQGKSIATWMPFLLTFRVAEPVQDPRDTMVQVDINPVGQQPRGRRAGRIIEIQIGNLWFG